MVEERINSPRVVATRAELTALGTASDGDAAAWAYACEGCGIPEASLGRETNREGADCACCHTDRTGNGLRHLDAIEAGISVCRALKPSSGSQRCGRPRHRGGVWQAAESA